MSLRTLMLLLVLAYVVVVVEPVSAATLWTNASRTTLVANGATATIASGTVTVKNGATTVNSCPSSTLRLRIEQNTTSGVVGTLTDGAFSSCFVGAGGNFPWTVTVRGGGATDGTTTVFTQTTWEGVAATLVGTPTPALGRLTDASGSPPANGVYARQAYLTESSICLVLNNAGTLSGPGLSDGKLDATYCLQGESATTWSLGDRRGTNLTGTALGVGPMTPTAAFGATLANGGSGSAAWSFTGGFGTSLQCTTTTADITVGVNGGATVNGLLDRLNFTDCTDNFSLFNMSSCTGLTPSAISFKAIGFTGGTAAFGPTSVRCPVATSTPPVACYYAAPSATGTYSNSPSTLAFSGTTFLHSTPAGITDAVPPSACGTSATLNVTLTDLTLGTTGTTVTLRTL